MLRTKQVLEFVVAGTAILLVCVLASCRSEKGNPPKAPGNLTGRTVSSKEIDLSWQDNSKDEDGFRIERAPGGTEDFKQIAMVGSGESTYQDQDTGLKPDTRYNYRLTAYNSFGSSIPSNVATAPTSPLQVARKESIDVTRREPIQNVPKQQGESGPSKETTLSSGETIEPAPVTRVDSIVMVLTQDVRDTIRSILNKADLIYTGRQILPYTPLVVSNDGIPGAPAKVVGKEEQGYCDTIVLTEAGGRTAIWLTVTYWVTSKTGVSGTSLLIPFALISPGYNSENPSQVLVTGYDLKPGTPLHFLEASDPSGTQWRNNDSSHRIPLLGTRMYVMPSEVEARFFPTEGRNFHMLSVFDQGSPSGGNYYLYAVRDRKLVLVFETSYKSLRDEQRNRNYVLAVVGGTFTSGNGLGSVGLSMKME